MGRPIHRRVIGWFRMRYYRIVRRWSRHEFPRATVGRFLDLSTGHLSEETAQGIAEIEGLLTDAKDGGWWVYVPQFSDLAELAAEHDWPPELLPILRLALKRKCRYVQFDCDGWLCRELPYFDW